MILKQVRTFSLKNNIDISTVLKQIYSKIVKNMQKE
ncbi:hypothetical protein KPC_2563 [Acinetobacter stercoris]|uniref:Uncharacterized protein n=1 Tax=Acinetobacter stercoris TaxID=2126983 RepID=A0A2U3N193_9GAMM|nr:hypothetical protein KPC_2563 [Acinetobacter stercoris]